MTMYGGYVFNTITAYDRQKLKYGLVYGFKVPRDMKQTVHIDVDQGETMNKLILCIV